MEGHCSDQAVVIHEENGNKEAATEVCMNEKITRKEIIREVKRQLWLALPLMAVTALQYGLQVATLMFVGHLSELELSGASMAISFLSVTGTSVLIGMSCALETLCGQSYGANQLHMLGVQLQRGTIVQLFVCALLSGVWASTGLILKGVGQDHAISEAAGTFAQFMIPGLFGYGVLQCIFRFLQTQGIIFPMIITSAIVFVIHIIMCWLMVFKSNFGFKGAALATSISFWLDALLLVLYVKVSSTCSKTWRGFSKDALHGLISYIRLAIPSAVMLCVEIWSFELVILLSGLLPNPQLETSVLSISFNTAMLLYMIYLGLGGAGSTRVSNELGAGHPRVARLASCVVIALAVVQGTIQGIVLISIRNIWGYAYSNDREVVKYVTTMTYVLIPTSFIDGLQCVLSAIAAGIILLRPYLGIVRGCGWQKIGAYLNIASYYPVGLPAAVVLAFVFHTGGKGLWIGMSCAVLVQAIALMVLLMRTNWEKEAEKATERINEATIPIELSATSQVDEEEKV